MAHLLSLISYDDLARLRLRDFLGDSVPLHVEESGIAVTVGLGGFERVCESSFGWRQGEPYRTAEVTLDLGPSSLLPKDIARQIIDSLGLPIAAGMTATELISVFGTPETDKQSGSKRFLRFVCGQEEHYFLGCFVDARDGLIQMFLARKDYCDEDDSI